jgi:hypothetical protein
MAKFELKKGHIPRIEGNTNGDNLILKVWYPSQIVFRQ